MTEALAPSVFTIEAQAASTTAVSAQSQQAAAAYVAISGANPESWYDTDAITGIARDLARLSDAYNVVAARLADHFTADAIATLSGFRFREYGVRDTVGLAGERGVREGVTSAGVFGRTADTYRYQQSLIDRQFIQDVKDDVPTPTELAAPLDAAVERAKRAAGTNVALAMRNQAQANFVAAAKRDLITGYRRVLHAELSKTGDCGLCIADTTRVYRSDHLMPMHPGCHCLPVPVTSKHDPGALINDRDLGRFYGDAHGTSAQALRATRYKVDNHGEVGPVLRPFGDPIRTEAQARRDANRARPKTDAEKVKTLRNRRDALVAAHARASARQTGPAWGKRLDDVADRIARLDRQIVKVGG